MIYLSVSLVEKTIKLLYIPPSDCAQDLLKFDFYLASYNCPKVMAIASWRHGINEYSNTRY